MKEIQILHCSDIHCGANFILSPKEVANYSRLSPECYLAEKVAKDVAANFPKRLDLVVVSGDVSESGVKVEFEMAWRFLEHLINCLRDSKKQQLSMDQLIVVPGNHDINFDDNKTAYKAAKGRKPAYQFTERLDRFGEFYKRIYARTSHARTYNKEQGIHIFRYPDLGMAVFGFNSCGKIGHTTPSAPGHLLPEDILSAFDQLKDVEKYPARIGIFHHNAVEVPVFGEFDQRDCLSSAAVDHSAFVRSGISALLYGHRHRAITDTLLPSGAKKSEAIACVGANSLGCASDLRPGSHNGYQMITIQIEDDSWDISVVSRVLDLTTPATGSDSTPGVFSNEYPKPSRVRLSLRSVRREKQEVSALRNESGRVKKEPAQRQRRGSLSVETLPKSKRLGTARIDISTKLESLGVFKGLGMMKEAQKTLNELKKYARADVDRALIRCLNSELEIRSLLDEEKMNHAALREKFQLIYNILSAPEIKDSFSSSVFPRAAFDTELARSEYWSTHFATGFSQVTRPDTYKYIREAREAFEKSKRTDHEINRHLILMLLNQNEFAHARQALLEAISLSPQYAPYYVLKAELAEREMRYQDALECLREAKSIMDGRPCQMVDFMIMYCHYFLGNYEEAANLMKKGIRSWPNNKGMANNYAFLKTREARREFGDRLWTEQPKKAIDLLQRFLKAIDKIGTHDTAHFNYALLVYWASLEGKQEIAIRILGDNDRKNLERVDDIIEYLFRKARELYLENHDYIHGFVASYFAEKAKAGKASSIRDLLLDEFAWDNDNFYTFGHTLRNRKRALLAKDRAIKNLFGFGHIATLRRWKRESSSFADTGALAGGGYYFKWQDKGLVVNPGAGFLANFQRRGYSINEIDAIIVTSSHYSAYEEFTDLLEQVKQAHRYRPKEERVAVYLEGSVLQRFPDLAIRKVLSIQNPQVLPDRETFLFGGELVLESAIPCDNAGHMTESTNESSLYNPPVLTRLKLMENGTAVSSICIVNSFCPSDSALSFLKTCDYLLVSIGAFTPYDLFKASMNEQMKADLRQLSCYDSLYIESFGLNSIAELPEEYVETTNDRVCGLSDQHNVSLDQLIRLADSIRDMKGKVVVLGNLPPELGDKRHGLAKVLNKYYPDGPSYLTEDLGLVIGLRKKEVLCECCHSWVTLSNLREECIEGRLTGLIKHFCEKHRHEKGFSGFLRREE